MVLMGSHTEILRNQRHGMNHSYQGTYYLLFHASETVRTHTLLPPLMVIQSQTIITTLWEHYALQDEGLHLMSN